MKRILSTILAAALGLGAALPAWAAPAINKGDTAWMFVATLLVIMMSIPGLALFYGGLVRAKNMLSILMQVFTIFALVIVLWCVYGYSLAFTQGGTAFIGGFDRAMLNGIYDAAAGSFSMAATFSKETMIPEFIFVAFQGTFAAITCALIVGAFAERVRFSAVMLFIVLFFTFGYLPIAHMVWFWAGPDAIQDAATLASVTDAAGYLWQKGALDFAGGTVVHINAAVAGLVAGDIAALAFINTLLATACATVSWVIGEWIFKKRPSMLGAASGAVSGLVAITPACGFVGPMGALVIGLLAGIICLWGVTGLKRLLGADDSLDVFGVHGVGGILGALLTGVFASPQLGGQGIWDYVANKASPDFSIANQVWVQAQAVGITIVWSALVSFVAFKLVDIVIGLRVPEDQEREGLVMTCHGESAYHS